MGSAFLDLELKIWSKYLNFINSHILSKYNSTDQRGYAKPTNFILLFYFCLEIMMFVEKKSSEKNECLFKHKNNLKC